MALGLNGSRIEGKGKGRERRRHERKRGGAARCVYSEPKRAEDEISNK